MHIATTVVLLLGVATGLEAQRLEIGTYVMRQGGAEITREGYRFDGSTLTDTTEIPSRGVRLESVATYDSDHSPVTFQLDVYLGDAQVPSQTVSVLFGDTAASWTASTPEGDSTGVTRLEGPYAFMQNLVFAQLAVTLLKYDHTIGGVQQVRVWIPEQALAFDMEIEFTSAALGKVRIAGTVMDVEVDDGGWLVRASVPVQNVVVERLDAPSSGS